MTCFYRSRHFACRTSKSGSENHCDLFSLSSIFYGGWLCWLVGWLVSLLCGFSILLHYNGTPALFKLRLLAMGQTNSTIISFLFGFLKNVLLFSLFFLVDILP